MREPDARLYFLEMGCSHFHMSRDDPEKYAQYRALGIAPDQERSWRGQAIAGIAKSLSEVTPTAEWAPFTSLISLCEVQANVESLQSLEDVTRQMVERLTPKGALIAAESLIGDAANHYDCGAIHLAVKLRNTDSARRFAEWSLLMLERAKAHNVDARRVEGTMQKWRKVKEHFRL